MTLSNVVLFLTPAVNYKFRVRARNIYGWGIWSPEATLFTSDVPLGTTSITMLEINMDIKISWTKPFENYNSIDMYRIYIQDSTGTAWNLDEVHCNGAEPLIVTERFCVIPMSTFRAAPHNLALDTEIVIRVQGHNDRGWGLFGTSTGGIHVQSEPEALYIPWRS